MNTVTLSRDQGQERSRGFESLPFHLRLRIYRHMLLPPSTALTRRSGTRCASECIEYTRQHTLVSLQGVSVDSNKEYMRELVPHLQQQLAQHKFSIYFTVPRYNSMKAGGSYNRMYCMPEDRRSPFHKDSVWYAKSSLGLHLAVAADVVRAKQNSCQWSPFAFNLDQVEHSMVTAKARAAGNGLSGYQSKNPRLVSADFTTFVRTAMINLSVIPAVHIYIKVPDITQVDRYAVLDLIHDLRYVGDNGYFSVFVYIQAEDIDPWREWVLYHGGRAVHWGFQSMPSR